MSVAEEDFRTLRLAPPPAPAPAPGPASTSSDRYHSPWPQHSHTLPHLHHYDRDRYAAAPPSPASSGHSDRYLPPPAPAPMDRYLLSPSPVPPPGSQPIERYVPPPAPAGPGSGSASDRYGPGDPYTRRDLGYHHHYRLPSQYHTLRAQQHRYNHHHVVTPSHGSRGLHHIRCCQSPAPSTAPGGNGGGGGSGSSSSSPAQYNLPSRLLPSSSSSSASSTASAASCGRHSSTPPPLPRCPSDELHQNGEPMSPSAPLAGTTSRSRRCARSGYAAVPPVPVQTQAVQTGPVRELRELRELRDRRDSVTWRGITGQQQPQQQQQPPQHQHQQSSTSSTSTSAQQQQLLSAQPAPSPPLQAASPTPPSSPPPSINVSSSDSTAALRPPSAPDSHSGSTGSPASTAPTTTSLEPPPVSPARGPSPPHSHHPHHLTTQMSAPAGIPLARSGVAFSSMERRPGPGVGLARHRLQRQQSKSEIVRNFIKRETAAFFGVDAAQEDAQKARWEDRRRRLAARKYGPLKEEFASPSAPTTPGTPATPYFREMQRGSALARPDVLPGPGIGDSTDSPRYEEPPVRRKESVAKMTFSGVAYVVSRLARQRAREPTLSRQLSRSMPPSSVPISAEDVRTPSPSPGLPPVKEVAFFDKKIDDSRELGDSGSVQLPENELSHLLDAATPAPAPAAPAGGAAPRDHVDAQQQHTSSRSQRWTRPSTDSTSESTTCREVGLNRIGSSFLGRAFDNSDRRQYGMGVVGRLFGRSLKRSVARQPKVQEQLEDIEDHRPYFTYWVTTVQILILFISLACYGLGTIGINLTQRSGLVLTTSLSLKQVDYSEPANFWIGPRAADLIHLGAKFAPCMRKDAKILKEIEESRMKERNTACCIRNDESGCVQSSRSDCSFTIDTWKKWTSGAAGPGGRISGSVCGLDPKYCEAPASIAPYEWPDDITKWPICRKTNSRGPPQRHFQYKDKAAEHMVCEVIGHPCCIGIHGSCEITTKEYCDFVRGYFHEEASLCSQVSCLDDVCGMMPFYSPEVPDQFYRLWTSLFLHAGLLHLAITILIQYFLMRDLEKLTGAFRIGVIYIGSGVAGNLASAIFVPYRAEVGPAGAQFGLLACLIVEVLNVWPMLKRPAHALLRLLGITLLLFILGMLPWVDNYAHVFGFIFGFLLSYALLPFVSFGLYDRQRKIALIWVCLLSSTFLFAALIALFYVIPVYDCEICNYFNCLPLTRDFCAEQNINLKRDDV